MAQVHLNKFKNKQKTSSTILSINDEKTKKKWPFNIETHAY